MTPASPGEPRLPSPPTAEAETREPSALPPEAAPQRSTQLGTSSPPVATPPAQTASSRLSPMPSEEEEGDRAQVPPTPDAGSRPGEEETADRAREPLSGDDKAQPAAANAAPQASPHQSEARAATGASLSRWMSKGGKGQAGPPPLLRPLFSFSALFGGASSSSSRPKPSFGRTTEPDRIDEGLFLGGFQSVCKKDLLKDLKVASILTVARGLQPQFPDSFRYTLVQVDDMAHVDLRTHFDLCFQAIDEGRAKGGIVVHCVAGISRSVTVTVAYLMRTKRWTLSKALAHVKRIRRIANPNPGFLKQLQQYQDELASERRKADTA